MLCKVEGCEKWVEGRTEQCASHNQADRKAARVKPEKKKAKIAPVSEKRKEDNAEYTKVRAAYLKANPECELCSNEATTIHHKAGRTGSLLTDKRHFLGCCMPCHTFIEMNPLWSKENGYSISRISA